MKLSTNARTFVTATVTDAFAKELKENQDKVDAVKKAYVERWNKIETKLKKVKDDANEEIRKIIKDSGLKLREGCSIPQASINDVDQDNYVDVCSYVYSDDHRPDNDFFRAEAKVREVKKRIHDAINRAIFEIEVHGSKQKLEEIINMVIADAKKNGKITTNK